jgi:hypothetical protein
MDLKSIIEEYKLDKKELARQLFPNNAFPDRALDRITQGLGCLYSDQIQKLAEILKVPPGSLFDSEWKASYEDNHHTFKKGAFTVILNANNWQTTIYKEGNLKIEKLIGAPNMTLEAYFSSIDKLLLTI